jgi:ubiquitin-conjugating enzyme E2 J1
MAPSPTIRRLLKETAELSSGSSNPTPAFHAAPVSDSDLHEWHFTLLGPPSPSPYAGGLYHGRITLPTSYPLKPPNFRFLTPSGRFEVNREICLSISGFHEETWMPAWGVRTALTALRTFMAEPGTAGQVGGLEAPAEVRKRLAGDSREWRCSGCGGRSNLEIMREWWGVCREKGVKVDEEGVGEDTQMEVLPEGMNLEARRKEQSKEEAKTQTTEATGRPVQVVPPKEEAKETETSRPSSSSNLQSDSSGTYRSRSPIPHTSTPTPESIQARAESYLSSSELDTSSTRHRRPMMGVHAPPLAAARDAVQNAAPLAQSQEQVLAEARQSPATLTIDRAIAGVFVMLVLMLLKKIFYPGGITGVNNGNFGYVDDNRGAGLYMEREM